MVYWVFSCVPVFIPSAITSPELDVGVDMDVGGVPVFLSSTVQRVESCHLHGISSFLQLLYFVQASTRQNHPLQNIQR